MFFIVQEYRLMYRVFDDKFANSTTVIIQVLDVNDNAPKFDNAIYNVTDVQEEEEGISKNNHKYLLTVHFCCVYWTVQHVEHDVWIISYVLWQVEAWHTRNNSYLTRLVLHLGQLYFYRDFYLYCSRPIQHQYYCIVIVYYCFLLWCWMNIKVEVEVEVDTDNRHAGNQ